MFFKYRKYCGGYGYYRTGIDTFAITIREWVLVMHPGLIVRHHFVQVSQIFCNETQKFWSALYMDSHLIACPPASLWEYDGLSSEGCVGEPQGPLRTSVDRHQLLLKRY